MKFLFFCLGKTNFPELNHSSTLFLENPQYLPVGGKYSWPVNGFFITNLSFSLPLAAEGLSFIQGPLISLSGFL